MADVPEGWSTSPPDTTIPLIETRESGKKNLPPEANYDYPRSNASGYLQIQPGTWKEWTKEFGVGQKYSRAVDAPRDVQEYIAYKADQKYGPNANYTWAASAPAGGYPSPRKPAGMEIPSGWNHTKPPAMGIPEGWSASPALHDRPPVPGEPWRVPKANEGQIVHQKRGDPGVEDPEFAARIKAQAPPETWAQAAGNPKHPMWQRIGDAIIEEGRRTIAPLGVFGDVARGKASMADPETQQRVIASGMLVGAREAPGGAKGIGAALESPKQIPVDKSTSPTAADVGPKAVEDALKPTLHRTDDVVGMRQGEEGYAVKDATGEIIATARIKKTEDGKTARVMYIGSEHDLGPAVMRDLARQYKAQNPGVSLFTGERVTGARENSLNRETRVSVGAAKTPLSQIVEHNLKTFNEENAKTPGFKEILRAVTNTIKSLIAPETIKDPLTGAKTGEEAAAIIRKREGQETRTAFQARAAMDKFTKFTNSLNLDEQLSMIKWMQNRSKGATLKNMPPEVLEFANTFKEWMLQYEDKLRALPDTEQMEFRQDFMHQAWKQLDQARQFLFGPGRMGSSGFTKKHVFEDYEEGIRAGLSPVTTNPMEIFARYVENASQFIAGKEILNDAKDAGLVKQLPMGVAAPEGYVPLNARAHPGTQLYAPPGFAEVYNNYVSKIPEGGKGNALRAVQSAANKTTAIKLAWSGFHMALETKVSWASGFANALTKGMRGDILGAAVELVKTPAKPFTSYFAARKAWRTYLDGEFGDPQMRRIVQGLVDANFDFLREGKLADEYRVSRLPGFIKSFERGRLGMEARDAFARIKARPFTGAAKEIYDTAMRTVQTVMEPVFQYYVPWLKTQAAVDAAKTALEARPDMTAAEFAAECRKISDNIDARFGEMNRNNIFWSQTQKAIAQSSAISYSYVYGIAKNAIGTGFDVAKLPSRAVMKARGMSNEMIWTDRMGFMIALPAIAITTNALYQYLKTGNAPNTIDMSKPKTGGDNEGQPERAVLPGHENSYMNFFNNPAGDLFAKLNPLWQTMIDLAENRDYRDKQIFDPQDAVVKRITDGAKFAAEQMGTPIVFEQEVDKKAGSNIGTPETLAGIRPAGFRDTNPEGFKQYKNYKDSEAKFESEWAKYQDKWVAAGHARYSLPHKKKQAMIQSIMQGEDPMTEFDKSLYGGTQ